MNRKTGLFKGLCKGLSGFLVFELLVCGFPWVSALTPASSVYPAPIPENLDTVRVEGVVYSPDGKPAAAALVWAACAETKLPVRHQTQTNRSGEFLLQLPKGPWRIWASKGIQGGEFQGKSWLANEITINPLEKPKPLSILLEERGMVGGQFVEQESGKPVANAKIYLNNGFVATSNAEGRWFVGGLTRSAQKMVVIAPGRYPAGFQFDTSGKRATTLNLGLLPGQKINCIVQDDQGKPVPNAWVGNVISDGIFSGQAGFTACGTDGKCQYFANNSTTQLSAGAPGFGTEVNRFTWASSANELNLTFQLKGITKDKIVGISGAIKKSRTISGTISLPDGKPAPGVLVQWGIIHFTTTVQTRSDPKGKFRFDIPEEENELAILPEGYQPEVISIPQKGNQSLGIQLKKGNTIAGIVVDPQGIPIEGVAVLPSAFHPTNLAGDKITLEAQSTKTDSNGRFSIQGLPAKVEFHLSKMGYSHLSRHPLEALQPDQKITLHPTGVLKGKFVRLDGSPVRNFRVTLNHPLARNPKNIGDSIPASYSGAGLWFSSDDGTFVISGLKTGSTWKVQAFANGMGEAIAENAEVIALDLIEKSSPTVIQAKKPVQLTIQLTDTQGNPIPNVKVTVADNRFANGPNFDWTMIGIGIGNRSSLNSDSKGVANFANLPLSEGVITFRAKGFERKLVPWRNGETRFDVTLKNEATVIGKIQIPKDYLGHNWYASLTSQTGERISLGIPESDNGKFVFLEIPEGTWELEVGYVGPVITAVANTPTVVARQTFELKPGHVKEWKGEWKP